MEQLVPDKNINDDLIPLTACFFYIEVKIGNDNKPHIRLLSSLKLKTNDEEYTEVSKDILTAPDLLLNIFPVKIDYIYNINLENNNTNLIKLHYESYNKQYVLTKITKPIYHCFKINNEDNPKPYNYYFNCLIFNEQDKASQYIPKAFILLSKHAYFRLFRYSLLHLHNQLAKSIKAQETNDQMTEMFAKYLKEHIVINIKTKDIAISFPDSEVFYNRTVNTLIPQCDLNYDLFFQFFNYNDILFLAEQYLLQNIIFIVSPHLEVLYPLFHTLLQFLYPISLKENIYQYCFFNPEIYHLFATHASFICAVYADKLNDAHFEFFAKTHSTNVTVITIIKKNNVFIAEKFFYVYRNQSDLSERSILIDNQNGNIQIPKVRKKLWRDKNIIEESLNYIKKEHVLNNKIGNILRTFTQNEIESDSFFNTYTKGKYNEIQTAMFNLIMKFLLAIAPKVIVKYTEGKLDFEKEKAEKRIESLAHCTKTFFDQILKCINDCSTFPWFSVIINKFKTEATNPNLESIIYIEELFKLFQLEDRNNPLYYNSTLHNVFESDVVYNNNIYYRYQSNTRINLHTIIMYEINCYYQLLQNKAIVFNNEIELAYGLTGLVLALMIIQVLKNLNKDTHLMNTIQEKIIVLYSLFIQSKGFNRKFNIVLSLMNYIFNLRPHFKEDFSESFIQDLIDLEITPTYSIILNIEEKMETGVENNELNKDLDKNKQVNTSFLLFKNNQHDDNKDEEIPISSKSIPNQVKDKDSNFDNYFAKMYDVLKRIVIQLVRNCSFFVLDSFYDGFERDIQLLFSYAQTLLILK